MMGMISYCMIFFLNIKLYVYCRLAAVEYCLTESFLARCPSGEVILMETAIFGRMKLNRCATKNYGYLGCSTNVLKPLDSACSGRQTCELSVSDAVLVRTQPCPADFTSYLEASFRCVPG